MLFDIYNEERRYFLMTEYAKSDRATCKGCLQRILKDSLKLAYIYYSEAYVSPQWHHFACLKTLPQHYQKHLNNEDVEGFSVLQQDDQRLLEKALVKLNACIVKKSKIKDETYVQDLNEQSEDITEEEESSEISEKPIKQQKQNGKKESQKIKSSLKNQIQESKAEYINSGEKPQKKKNQKSKQDDLQKPENIQEKQIMVPQKLSSWKNILKKRVINNDN